MTYKDIFHHSSYTLTPPPDEVPVLGKDLKVSMATAGQRATEVDVQDARRSISANALGPHRAGDVLVQSDRVVERAVSGIANALTGSGLCGI